MNAFSIDLTPLAGVPEHWERRPLWTLLSRRDGVRVPDAPLLSVYRDYGVVRKDSRSDNFNKPSEDLSLYRYVRSGDLVLNKMKTWQGSLAVSQFDGIVSPAYYVCEISKKLHPRFAHYALRSSQYIDFYARLSKGIRPNQWDLPFEDFRRLPLAFPSLAEQARIADFLDFETVRTSTLIDSMNRQLGLLVDRRKQVFEMAWLNSHDQPKKRLGYATMLVTSGSRAWGEFIGESGSLFFRSMNLRKEDIIPNLSDPAYAELPVNVAAEAKRSRIEVGDVLVGITGANAGWTSLADESVEGGNVSQHVCLVRPDPRQVESRWLAYIILSPTVQDILVASQYGGTKTQLSLPDIRNLEIPVLSLERQAKVAAEIDERSKLIDLNRDLRTRQISLLKERLRVLIDAAVTGQTQSLEIADEKLRSSHESIS